MVHESGLELERVKAENSRLKDDLAQCEKDKEFVWSLWKRLQVASPDLTAAISEVQRHEAEKQEARDQKVLLVLESKDGVIRELEETVATMRNQLEQTSQEFARVNESRYALEQDNSLITQRVREIELLVSDREHAANLKAHAAQQAVADLQQQNVGMKARCESLQNEIDEMRRYNTDFKSRNTFLERKVSQLEEELSQLSDRYKSLSSKYSSAVEEKSELDSRYRAQANESSQYGSELERLSEENQRLRRRNEELQTSSDKLNIETKRQIELIRQLQSLQKDTEGVMKNQEDIHNTEKKNYQQMYYETSAKLKESTRNEHDLRAEFEKYKSNTKIDMESLKERLIFAEAEVDKYKPKKKRIGDFSWCDLCNGCDYKVSGYESEIKLLHSKLNEKNRLLQALEVGQNGRSRSVPKSVKSRPRSLSPASSGHNQMDLARKLTNAEKKVADLTRQLKSTQTELEEVKKAHERRLARFKSVQHDHTLLKEQLRTYELSESRSATLNDITPRDNSSGNSRKRLEFLQSENKKLLESKIQLQETVDRLRVERARDSALMSDLQASLADHNSVKHDSDSEVKRWMDHCREVERRVVDLQEQVSSLQLERDAIARECKALTESLENQCDRTLQHGRKSKKCRVKSSKVLPKSVKQKQLSVSRSSVSRLNADAENSDDGDEWDDSEVTQSSRSLGQKIVANARHNKVLDRKLRNTSAQTDIDSSNVSTLAHLVGLMSGNNSVSSTPRSDRTLTPRDQPVVYQSAPAETSNGSTGSRKKQKQVITKLRNEKSLLNDRIEHLTEQNSTLRDAKDTLQRTIESLTSQVEKLQSEQQNTSAKLRSAKAKEQKLSTELELLRREKESMERKVETQGSQPTSKSDADIKNMELRLKNSLTEIGRQRQEIKSLTEEKEKVISESKNLQERVSRLDRDIGQKRSLIENLRFKIKTFEENAKQDLKQQGDIDCRFQMLKESSDASKRTIENLRTQLAHYKELHAEDAQKVEKLQRSVRALECKKSEIESFASEVENVATEQLEGLASQSEAAIEKLQKQLKDAGIIVKEFINVFRSFTNELITKLSRQQRDLSTKKLQCHRSKYSQGMLAARSKAAEILDLSTEDIDDILSPNDSGVQIYSKTESWRNRFEEVLNCKAPFASDMLTLMFEVLAEYTSVISQSATLQSDQ